MHIGLQINNKAVTLFFTQILIYKTQSIYVFIRWVSVVEFHDGALGIGKVFGHESTEVKWNY